MFAYSAAHISMQAHTHTYTHIHTQGCNRRVQHTIWTYFNAGKDHDGAFYRCVRNVFEATMQGLKDFKRTIKSVRSSVSNSSGGGSISSRRGMSMDSDKLDGYNGVLNGFGRESYVMFVLRLLQLLCKRHRPLQVLNLVSL